MYFKEVLEEKTLFLKDKNMTWKKFTNLYN